MVVINEFGSGGFWDLFKDLPEMVSLSHQERQAGYDAAKAAARRYDKALTAIRKGFPGTYEDPAPDFALTDRNGNSALFLLRVVNYDAYSSINLFQVISNDRRCHVLFNSAQAYQDGVPKRARDLSRDFAVAAKAIYGQFENDPVLAGITNKVYVAASYLLLLRASFISGRGDPVKSIVKRVAPNWPAEYRDETYWSTGGGDA